MKITAQHLKRDNVIDRIVKEPVGGAHRDPVAAARLLGTALTEEIDQLSGQSGAALIAAARSPVPRHRGLSFRLPRLCPQLLSR
jgi:acetyl-CoA carboxylase alpha subunit